MTYLLRTDSVNYRCIVDVSFLSFLFGDCKYVFDSYVTLFRSCFDMFFIYRKNVETNAKVSYVDLNILNI